jgi:fatty-acyl-CoA synthase
VTAPPAARAPTLPEALRAAAEGGPGRLVFHLEEGPIDMPPSDLLLGAVGRARVLRSWGIEAGRAVGLLGPNRPEWAMWAFGAWLAGAVLVPLPLPLRIRDRGAFAAQTASLVRAAGCTVVVAEPRVLDALSGVPTRGWDHPPGADPASWEPPQVGPTDPAVIQFTSGSTGSPKGAVLTHHAILGSVRSVARHYRLTETDRQLAWLPLFHDQGLFGYLVRSVVLGLGAHIVPTERFARDPALWFRLVREVGATVTAGPSSGWAVALRAAGDGADLSSLRVAVLAAEMIDPRVVDGLLERASALQLDPRALVGAYGLAEATLGVAATIPGEGLRTDEVDLGDLRASGRARPAGPGPAKRVVSCGRPMPGVDVRIMGPEGRREPERVVGEIQVRCPTLMTGYVGSGGADPFEDGWLRTRDLGYLGQGELYVTGRAKDLLVVLGRNVSPEDLEWASARVHGVREGRSVAFASPEAGEGRAVVVVEAGAGVATDGLAERVRDAIFDTAGVAPAEVLVVSRGTVPKTTSGKLRRGALRDAYAAGTLTAVARWGEGAPGKSSD